MAKQAVVQAEADALRVARAVALEQSVHLVFLPVDELPLFSGAQRGLIRTSRPGFPDPETFLADQTFRIFECQELSCTNTLRSRASLWMIHCTSRKLFVCFDRVRTTID